MALNTGQRELLIARAQHFVNETGQGSRAVISTALGCLKRGGLTELNALLRTDHASATLHAQWHAFSRSFVLELESLKRDSASVGWQENEAALYMLGIMCRIISPSGIDAGRNKPADRGARRGAHGDGPRNTPKVQAAYVPLPAPPRERAAPMLEVVEWPDVMLLLDKGKGELKATLDGVTAIASGSQSQALRRTLGELDELLKRKGKLEHMKLSVSSTGNMHKIVAVSPTDPRV